MASGARALAVFIHAVTAAIYPLLAWYALQNAIIAHDQTTPVLRIPWSVGYGCLSLGLAMVAMCSLAAIVRHTLGGEEVRVDLADPGAGRRHEHHSGRRCSALLLALSFPVAHALDRRRDAGRPVVGPPVAVRRSSSSCICRRRAFR